MAGLTLSTADAVLKEDYQTAIREQLNNTNMLLQQVEKNTEDVVGRRALLALHVQRSPAVGARAELGTLPGASNQGYFDEYVNLRYNYGRIQISGPVIKAMASDRGSFVRAVKSETDMITNDLKRDVNRQLFGTSDGVIVKCGTTSSSTTIVLDTNATQTQMRQLAVGNIVDIGTVANPSTIASAVTITAQVATQGSCTITVSGSAVSTTSSHFIFNTGAGGSGASQKETTGLQTIISATGTLFNVNPSTYPVWAAYADPSNATPGNGTLRTPTEVLFAKTAHNIQINSGKQPNLIATTHGAFRTYSAQLTAIKRFPDELDLKGGFKGLSVAAGGENIALVWDRDCPGDNTTIGGTAFFLSTENLIEFYSSDWEWMDLDGSVLFRVSGTDAYEATLFKYAELATDRRNAHGIINYLTES